MIVSGTSTPARKQIFEIIGDGVATEFALKHDLGRFVVLSTLYDEDYVGYICLPDKLYPEQVILKFATCVPKGKKFYAVLVG